MPHDDFHVYDTTLRDGAQREGLSFTVADKLAVARHLDDLGVGFIEGGWPGANPKDTAFFQRARTELSLRTATLTAFGSTRRPATRAADDPQVAQLRTCGAPVVCLVAKAHARHVTDALGTTLRENLAMVTETVAHLRAEGQRVFVDAEHFFDGYAGDRAYALEVVRAAAEAGADVVVLCDTNGGTVPSRLAGAVGDTLSATGSRLGIHCHDDIGCAVAGTLAAVEAGATHVQGTAGGYGERCGNADLFSVIAGLQLKLGRRVLPPDRLAELSLVARAVAEVAGIAPDRHAPYVGRAAFAHKAGLHASAVRVAPELYQHVEPALVGNDTRLLVSELAGRASVELKGRELGYDLAGRPAVAARVVARVKEREAAGYAYEAADASFELLLREELEGVRPEVFRAVSWRVLIERLPSGETRSLASIELVVDGVPVTAQGTGNGPVNALDRALRTALSGHHPEVAAIELVDYKVRIVEGEHGTGAITRVHLETTDGSARWSTVGVGDNVVDASWQALADAVTYGLDRGGSADRCPAAAVSSSSPPGSAG